jgi:hypothetical protein
MKLAGVWEYQVPALKVLEDWKNKFQAMKVSKFKPDHCCRKIKSPLRFLQKHMCSNNHALRSNELKIDSLS